MAITEINAVKLKNPLFCKRFLDDIITRRMKNYHDIICQNLNSYYAKINLTIEVNPSKFMDTKIANNNTTEYCNSVSKNVQTTCTLIIQSSQTLQAKCYNR